MITPTITPTITPSDSSLHSSAAPPPPSPPPAAALEGIWELLDVLPQAESPPDLSATTIEMVALSLTGGKSTTHSFARTWQRGSTGRWAIAAAAVMGALVLGVLAGRASLPSPSARLVAFLPIAQHVDLLVEAGSVTFLQALAAQPYPPPRQFDAFQLKGDAQFNAAMDSLRRLQADLGLEPKYAAARRPRRSVFRRQRLAPHSPACVDWHAGYRAARRCA